MELDLLELRLWELDPIVDVFVIAEYTWDHKWSPKPPTFLRNTQRFARLLHKIFHVVPTREQMMVDGVLKNIEKHPRSFLVNHYINSFDPPKDTVFVFGDVDEFPCTEHLWYLKHCKTLPDAMPLKSGVANYRYTFDWIQPTDWPAYKNNWLALQFPNIFTRQALQRQPGGPRWYKRARYLTELPPGGMHMSWLTYMPSVMLKVAMNRDFDFQLGSFCDSERTQAAVRPSFLTSLSSIYITMTRGKHWEVGPRHPYP